MSGFANKQMTLLRVALLVLLAGCHQTPDSPYVEHTEGPTQEDLESLPWPKVTIRSGDLSAVLALPDEKEGFYQGSRFDHSPFIFSAQKGRLQLFGPWFIPFQRERGDGVTGMSGEFAFENSIGYDEAKPGEAFLRIGVGHVRRADAEPYRFYLPYVIVERGTWEVSHGQDYVVSRHTIPPLRGWAYTYSKKTELLDDSTIRIEYRLENTGQRRIDTDYYCHNFFVFNGEKVSSGDRIEILTDGEGESLPPPAFLQPTTIGFADVVVTGTGYTWTFPQPTGRIPSAIARVVHSRSGASITLSGDYPLEKLVIYVQDKALCPEPFVRIRVEPGQSFSWSDTYHIQVNHE